MRHKHHVSADMVNSWRKIIVRKHKVMLGDKLLYQASQLSHAQRFAKARQAEGVPCHVVPDETPKRPRKVRINGLTGKPYRKVTSEKAGR